MTYDRASDRWRIFPLPKGAQGQLGVFVGAARESVNRQLRLWRKDGIVDLQRGRVLLQNIGKLSAVARNE